MSKIIKRLSLLVLVCFFVGVVVGPAFGENVSSVSTMEGSAEEEVNEGYGPFYYIFTIGTCMALFRPIGFYLMDEVFKNPNPLSSIFFIGPLTLLLCFSAGVGAGKTIGAPIDDAVFGKGKGPRFKFIKVGEEYIL